MLVQDVKGAQIPQWYLQLSAIIIYNINLTIITTVAAIPDR